MPTFHGTANNDRLRGEDNANDMLYGYEGDDTLSGGKGNDTLDGGPGNDVFVFNKGDGKDMIRLAADANQTDTIRFGKGITLADLRIEQHGVDANGNIQPKTASPGYRSLVLKVGNNTGDQIVLWGRQWFGLEGMPDSVWQHRVSFADGKTLTMRELLEQKPVYCGTALGENVADGLGGGNHSGYVFPDILVGTDGAEGLRGYGGDDRLSGEAGDDTLEGYDGNDTLEGGKGNDTLDGGLGKDTFIINKGDGKDIILEATSDDTIKLGEGITPTRLAVSPTTGLSAKLNGDDLVVGIGKNQSITLQGWNTQTDRLLYLTLSYGNNMKISLQDLLNGISTQPSGEVWYADPPGKQGITKTTSKSLSGTKNNDILKGSGKKSLVLNGAGGHDRLTGSAGNDKLNGGTGNDWVNGGKGNDTLKGGTGNDWLIGGAGNDSLLGESGNDTLLGGDGKDILKGGAGKDWLSGEVGDDNLYGDAGNDTLSGGAGKDKLYGGAGDDWLYGDAGNDRLSGGEGNDYLFGGDGADKLYGEKGNDTLSGGAGKDTLSGGAGKDRFLFDTALSKSSNVDSISDFRHGEDKIQLKQSIFAKLNTGTLRKANFKASAKGVAGDSNDYILYNTKTGALLYDADGSGKGAAIQFATLSNKPKNLTAGDFIVVS